MQLRNWLTKYEQCLETSTDTDLHRMVGWARERLNTLEADLDPLKLTDELVGRKLFPKSDELYDPLGEPPPERAYW
jgi:hypothetical protein